MKVEFADCELGIGVALYVSGSEYLKGGKSKEDFYSLAAATDAFYNQQGIDYYINHTDYDTVKQWIKPSDAIIFVAQTDRYDNKRWFEIHASIDNRYTPIIWSENGKDYFIKDASELIKRQHKKR